MITITIPGLAFSIFFIFLISSILTGISIAPWVPCRRKDLERINRLANLGPGQKFYELGCGDGRVCRHIAEKNLEAQVIGIELSIPVYIAAKLLNFFFGPENVKIKFGNALKEDLSEADAVFIFGLNDSMNKKLRPKFERELRKGAKIISYVFKIDDWTGKSVVDKPDKGSLTIYSYDL